MSTTSTHQEGTRGEQVAVQHLRQLGMEIVEMNYRFGRGEIDIIAHDGDVLVFCEVKSRTGRQYGDPEYSITKKKRRQIRRIAEGYLYEHEIKEQACRFDVVTVRWLGNKPEINYIRNAF
jgi:putative endonuclease